MFHEMTEVPEPKGLLNFNSYKFYPTRADAGHPLPPCAPTHKNYIKRLTKNLRSFKNYPEEFEGLTLHRRKQFDKKMRRDEEIAEMREEARQETLAAEAEIRESSPKGSASSG
mmetsp:Transcript_50761/g.91413  ORF Transcript_50761/g.91413 Transcript_50761/m.91413 type:complete len:113 (+) Transcript_50761:273-611(+)